ncbi:hypothetical protein Tco_1023462, partial [Tanacetum coccineum]
PSDDDDDDDDTDDEDEDEEPFEDEGDDEEESPQIRVPFSQTRLRRARKTVRLEPPMSPSMEARIAEYAAAPTPPLPVASPPLPLPSPLTTSPTDAGAPLGYMAAGIRMRAASPPLLLPSTSHRTDILEVEMPPRKRACFATPAPGFEIGESSAASAARQPGPAPEADTWDEIVEAMLEVAPTTLEGVDQRVTELDTTVRQRTKEFQVRFEEAYDDRAYLRARVNTLFRDRPYHHHTALALDREAVYARIAWTGSEERSAAIEAHVRTLEAQVVSLAWETISEIEHAFEDKQYQPEGILELFRKLYDDVQNIHEELAEYINTPSWNRPTIYCDDDDEDYTIAITPELPITDSLIMEDEHLDTISAMKSD